MKYLLLLFFLTASLSAADLKKIAAYPQVINLDNKDDFQGICAQAFFSDLSSLDITKLISIKIQDPAICRYKNGRFLPLKDGQTVVDVSYKGLKTQLTVHCRNTGVQQELSYNLTLSVQSSPDTLCTKLT